MKIAECIACKTRNDWNNLDGKCFELTIAKSSCDGEFAENAKSDELNKRMYLRIVSDVDYERIAAEVVAFDGHIITLDAEGDLIETINMYMLFIMLD